MQEAVKFCAINIIEYGNVGVKGDVSKGYVRLEKVSDCNNVLVAVRHLVVKTTFSLEFLIVKGVDGCRNNLENGFLAKRTDGS